MSTVVVVTNTRVDPPVGIEMQVGAGPRGYATARYFDPGDNGTYNPADLTALERGRVVFLLEWDTTSEVVFPLRFADKSAVTWMDLRGGRCATYGRRRPTSRLGTNPPGDSCLLGLTNFVFERRRAPEVKSFLESEGWIVIDAHLPNEYLAERLRLAHELQIERLEFVASVRAMRPLSELSSVDLMHIATELGLCKQPPTIQLYAGGRTDDPGSLLGTYKVTDLTDPAASPVRGRFYETFEPILRSIRMACDSLAASGVDSLLVEIDQILLGVNPGQTTPTGVDLRSELDFLSRFYGSMRYVSAVGNDVKIELPTGVTIILRDDRVDVEGDVTRLVPFRVPAGADDSATRHQGGRFARLLMPRDGSEQ